jgi:hypothetical protein
MPAPSLWPEHSAKSSRPARPVPITRYGLPSRPRGRPSYPPGPFYAPALPTNRAYSRSHAPSGLRCPVRVPRSGRPEYPEESSHSHHSEPITRESPVDGPGGSCSVPRGLSTRGEGPPALLARLSLWTSLHRPRSRSPHSRPRRRSGELSRPVRVEGSECERRGDRHVHAPVRPMEGRTGDVRPSPALGTQPREGENHGWK